MNAFEQLLEIVAPSILPVLLLGESGCGKEVAARALHGMSPRSQGPLIAVNCAALSSSLLESQLCGHLRGAFTGADKDQAGFVRAAEGGTLFLDELGELPPEAQGRLLRILQEKCVIPVGAQKEIPVDFRLVCATHRDLERLVGSGLFRQDLYYRIATFPIRLPALRERLHDLPAIARQIWKNVNPSEAPPLNEREMALLLHFLWPGNIRQLRNVLERFALLREHGMALQDVLAAEPLPAHAPSSLHERSTLAYKTQRSRAPGWAKIAEILQSTGHNKSHAARQLGISRGSLCYQLKKHGQ